MKHVKLFEGFSTPKPLTEDQINWLDECATGWRLNPSTGLVDVDGDFKCYRQGLKDFKGVAFGHIKGNFNCDNNQLTSLEGAPKTVNGYFSCSSNQLTSLEGAPQTVDGSFYCANNQLTSLEGAPQTVGGDFYCGNNQLTSLNGAPNTIKDDFNCSGNRLTNLEGAPQTVDGSFSCAYNQPFLTSLIGAPKSVGGGFDCSNNQLTSLDGAPNTIKGDFFSCADNQLTSLEGAPETVKGYFNCDNNQLTSLKGAQTLVCGSFDCDSNPLKSLVGAPESVGSFKISRWDSDPGISTLDWKKGWSKKGDKEFTKTFISKLKEINALGSDANKCKLTSMLLSLTGQHFDLLEYLLSLRLSTSDKFEIYGAIKANTPDVWNKIKDEVDPEGDTSDLIDLGF
jgi:hypothetical protein